MTNYLKVTQRSFKNWCYITKAWLWLIVLQWWGGQLTPAGVPQTAAWAPSLSQGAAGHQASWQPLSCCSRDSLLLLLLHGMAVVPLTGLWTALHANIRCVCVRHIQTTKLRLKWWFFSGGSFEFYERFAFFRKRLKHKLSDGLKVVDTHMCWAGSSLLYSSVRTFLHMLQFSLSCLQDVA